jgi:hypothetical protein
MSIPAPGVLWAATLFLAAALTFSIQPLYARMLLPHLGGAPAVWVVSLLFFQSALLAGYAYAHALAQLRSLAAQVALHAVLLGLAATWLPPALRASTDVGAPALSTIVALASGVGLPYAVLVATAPLLQHWFSRARSAADPYVLYAASNGGSLAGLLAYPFLLEPWLGLRAQAWGWAAAYGACALLIAVCGLLSARLARWVEQPAHAAPSSGVGGRIGLTRYARWLALAALPTAWLGAGSTYVTTAVAPIPLLWVLPLAGYLVTLILAFAPPAAWRQAGLPVWQDAADLAAVLRQHRLLATLLAVAAAAVALAVRAMEPAPLVVLVHVAGLFAGALACHTALAADRPHASHATVYYLALASGGALGGAFAAVVAPLLFDTLFEYPLVLAAFIASGLARPRGRGSPVRTAVASVVAIAVAGLVAAGATHWFLVPLLLGGAVLLTFVAARVPLLTAAALLAVLFVSDTTPIAVGYSQEWVERSFFGVNRVLTTPDGSRRVLLNGLITHGVQALDPVLAAEPQGYYTRGGPLGDILEPRGAGPDRAAPGVERVGVVGLGAGAIACYADTTRQVSFYEIDPAVVGIARDPALFTYLRLCPPAEVVLGDGRLVLEAAPSGSLDVVIVDAYSGDTMPLHLLTREAFGVYRRVLAPGGVIALHVSNKFFDLEPLVAALAADAGLAARIRVDVPSMEPETEPREQAPGWTPSIWTLVGAEPDLHARLNGAEGWRALRSRPNVGPWTDDYANPLAIRR